MKVALILTPVEYGGAEKVNIDYLGSIDRAVFDIHPIVLIRPWEDQNLFIDYLNEYNYKYSTIPVAKKSIKQGRDYFRIIRTIYLLHKILSHEKYDIVHTHGYFADIIGSIVSHANKIPHIATCHGFISNDKYLKVYNIIDKYTLRYCDKIIAVSDPIKSELVNCGVHSGNIITIQNATRINLEEDNIFQYRNEKRKELSIGYNDYVIGYVGRLSEEKGLEYLLQAVYKIKRRMNNCKVIIMGDGPRKKDLEILCTNLGLMNNIIFTGFVDNVEQWYPALDVFVLPSLTEGTPLVILEAMQCGVPVIATMVGGIPDVIRTGENGIVIKPRCSEDIESAIIKLIEHEKMRGNIIEKAKETVKEKYSVNKWIRMIEAEYIKLVEK